MRWRLATRIEDVDPKLIVSNEIALADLPAMFETLRGSNTETKVHVHCCGA